MYRINLLKQDQKRHLVTDMGVKLLGLISLTILSMFLLNCSKVNFSKNADGNGALPPPDTYVCDPGSGAGQTPNQHGLKGELYSLPTHQCQQDPSSCDQLSEYIRNENRINTSNGEPVALYLKDINYPTQRFDRGFISGSGATLYKPNSNELLMEWFGFRVKSTIVNNTGVARKFVALVDDGVSVKINGQEIIRREGIFATTLSCQINNFVLASGSSAEIEVTYYQAPRNEIAVMLLWRDTNRNEAVECGRIQGPDKYFFDPATVPSTPGQGYNYLLATGWTPVPAQNFVLQNGEVNPCL